MLPPDDPELIAVAKQQTDAQKQPATTKVSLANQEKQVIVDVITARHQAGLSQTQLAELVGMSQPSLARIEAAKVSPSLRTLVRLTSALGVRINLLK